MIPSNSNERLSFLKSKGFDPGSTFIPAQELSKLQAGLTQSTKLIQETYLTTWFPELLGKTVEQMKDWLNRNRYYFDCAGLRKPDPNKIKNELTYLCYRDKKYGEFKRAFIVCHEIIPLPTGGFKAMCTHEEVRWPDDVKILGEA